MQYSYETFQNVAKLCNLFEMNTASQLQSKGCCKKETGSYKFMFSLANVAFYRKKILQLAI